MTSATSRTFRNLQVRFSVRLNYVLFPIDGFELSELLSKSGYIRAPMPSRPTQHRVTLGFTGPIAQKGGNLIDGDSSRGIFGVTGPSFSSVASTFDELITLIKNEVKIDIKEGVGFYEIIATLDLESVNNPLQKIAQIFENTEFINKAKSILNEDVSVFSFKFAKKGKIPNQEEWFDITIEPDLIKPLTTYKISIVYRSAEEITVRKFGEALESNISKLIDEIEK